MKIELKFDIDGKDGFSEKALAKVYMQAEDMYHALSGFHSDIIRPMTKYDTWPEYIYPSDEVSWKWDEGGMNLLKTLTASECAPSDLSSIDMADVIALAFRRLLEDEAVKLELLL